MEAIVLIILFALVIWVFSSFFDFNSSGRKDNSSSSINPSRTIYYNGTEYITQATREQRRRQEAIDKQKHQAEQAKRKAEEATRNQQQKKRDAQVANQLAEQVEAEMRAEIARVEKNKSFEEYLQRQEKAAEKALEKKLAAEWEAKQKQIAEQTERLKQAAEAEKLRVVKERAEQRRQVEQRAEQQRQAAAREAQRPQAIERAELELFENDTDYYYALQGIYSRNPYPFSFAGIRRLSSNTGVWDELENGVAQLETAEQLEQYTFSYGNMHRAKLLQAFEALVANRQLDLNGQHIEIIDYGCGQGIGTVVFIDFLKSHPEFTYTVRRVRLIEPSLMALKRAALHIRYSLQSARQPEVVHAINKEMDDITIDNLRCDAGTIKFHIFSNILDVTAFDLYDLYDKIVDSTNGLNYFICVSPNLFSDGSHPRNQRLVKFRQYFDGSHNTTLISRRTCSIPSNGSNSWTRFEKVFKVDFGREPKNDNKVKVKFSAKEMLELYAPKRKVVEEPDDLPF